MQRNLIQQRLKQFWHEGLNVKSHQMFQHHVHKIRRTNTQGIENNNKSSPSRYVSEHLKTQ